MPKLKSSDSTIVSIWERKFANASIEGQSLLLADPSQELLDCYNRLLEAGSLHKTSILLSHRVRNAARIAAKRQKEGGSLNVTTIPSAVDNNNIIASSQAVKKAAAGDEGHSAKKGTKCARGKTSGEAEVMSRSDHRTSGITAIEAIFRLLREEVGEDACNTLKGKIMACPNKSGKAKESSLFDLEITARDLMSSHPVLLEQFLCFLPKKIDTEIQGPQTRGGKKGGTKSAIERNREDNNSKDKDVSVVIGSHTKGRGHPEALSILTRYCEGLDDTDFDGFNELLGTAKKSEEDDDLSDDLFDTMNEGYNEGDTVNEMKGKGVYKSDEREEDDELSVDSLFFDEVDDMEDLSYYRDPSDPKSKRGRQRIQGGPEPPNYEGMTKASADLAKAEYTKLRRKFTDSLANKARKDNSKRILNGDIEVEANMYSGNCSMKLRAMGDVESSPMMVDHTYHHKDIVMLRIAEEANKHGTLLYLGRSDNKMIVAKSKTVTIKVTNTFSSSWKVTTYDINDAVLDNDDDANDMMVADGKHDDDDDDDEEDNANENVNSDDDDNDYHVLGGEVGDADNKGIKCEFFSIAD
jgi:hypothetical protein